MFVLYVTILLDYTIKTTEQVLYETFQLCFAIADVKFLLAYAIEMTELIDMFEMTELIDMFVLCLKFLLCHAIADLKQEREESRREREAASNAACIILARIAGPRYVL